MCRLDEETEFMMYEPGERQVKGNDLRRLRSKIKAAASGYDLLLAEINENDEIIGYIQAEKGKLNRISHTAYIVVGIRRQYRGQGIGTEFFQRLDQWAKANGIIRLELTVECTNPAAKRLYEKNGFQVEGIRSKAMKVNGRLTDEYYMAKILD